MGTMVSVDDSCVSWYSKSSTDDTNWPLECWDFNSLVLSLSVEDTQQETRSIDRERWAQHMYGSKPEAIAHEVSRFLRNYIPIASGE